MLNVDFRMLETASKHFKKGQPGQSQHPILSADTADTFGAESVAFLDFFRKRQYQKGSMPSAWNSAKRSTFKLLEEKQNIPKSITFDISYSNRPKKLCDSKALQIFHIFRTFGFGLLPSSPHDAEASGAWPYAGHPPRKHHGRESWI